MSEQYWDDIKIAEYFDVTDDYKKDLPYYLSLAQSNAKFLDLGSGTGRVATELAKAGASVTGIERSPAMLSRAQAKANAVNPKGDLKFIEGDMCDFALDVRDFDVAYIAEYSFAYLYDIDDQLACLGRIRKHLKSGGLLVIHMFQPNPVYFSSLHLAGGVGGAILEDTGYLTLEGGNNLLVSSTTTYHRASQELHSNGIFEEISPDGATTKRVLPLRTHVYYPNELELLLRTSGYTIEGTYGDFDESPLEDDSWEMIAVARS